MCGSVSKSTAACCSAVQCVAVRCSVLLRAAVCVLQCVAVCCSVLQCVAVCCSVLHLPNSSTLQPQQNLALEDSVAAMAQYIYVYMSNTVLQ